MSECPHVDKAGGPTQKFHPSANLHLVPCVYFSSSNHFITPILYRVLELCCFLSVNSQKVKMPSLLGCCLPLPFISPAHIFFLATYLLPFPITYCHYRQLVLFLDSRNTISTSREDTSNSRGISTGAWDIQMFIHPLKITPDTFS